MGSGNLITVDEKTRERLPRVFYTQYENICVPTPVSNPTMISADVWLDTISRDVHTRPVNKIEAINGHADSAYPLARTTYIRPNIPPTPMACILIFRKLLSTSATLEARKIP